MRRTCFTSTRSRHTERGISFIELLISAAMVALAAMAAVAHVTRGVQRSDWTRDRVFARQKALSILAEMRSYVEGGEGEVAADLDGFDDGVNTLPNLTIQPDVHDEGAYLMPGHPTSGNIRDEGTWRWQRQIVVRRFPGVNTRDLRVCTVRMFRQFAKTEGLGERMAEVSGVIRTIGDAFPSTQVYDVYLIALDNVPGWWVFMDAIQPFIEATLTDLESRNPGLSFRTHWITKSGFGRDEEYAPYTNEVRTSTDSTPWAYVYPGRMPEGESAQRYYVAGRMGARTNVDGELTPVFQNGLSAMEPFTDDNGNGERDPGEPFTDSNGNLVWDVGNGAPYAMADMHNHCMRYPDAVQRMASRVAAKTDRQDTPTWRLLLDRMILHPERYHNAILINLHGELVPMPAVRNYSDAAKAPTVRPGWRAVAHPELLRPQRVAGDPAMTDDLAWRVYAYKAGFYGTAGNEVTMSGREPFFDIDGDNVFTDGVDTLVDWNGNGVWDEGIPLTFRLNGGDFTWAINAASGSPSLQIQCLSGGVDADGSGLGDPYVDWADAPVYPEPYVDANSDGYRQVVEPFLDLNGDYIRQTNEPYTELDGDGAYSNMEETLTDTDSDGAWTKAEPNEPFTDTNGNGAWDGGEPWWDVNGNGYWDPPTLSDPPAYQPWDGSTMNPDDTNTVNSYVEKYGEPFMDMDGDEVLDLPEPFDDYNQNGVRESGVKRGEMWWQADFDGQGTVLNLHNTPLETPLDISGLNRGLATGQRLYDLDYIPCPTPNTTSAGGDRFHRDLFHQSNSLPKNTARWRIVAPAAAVQQGFATTSTAFDGDARDRTVLAETWIGYDTTAGTMWPTRHQPQNLSRAYSYFHAGLDTVPFSERFQFIGDPRHCPYADLDRYGSTSKNGYNWYFDSLNDGTNVRGKWRALKGNRLADAWMGNRGSSHDVPRLLGWLRYALVRNEAIYTTLTGFSYYYMSVGGDVGYDSANGFSNSIPMDGTPFGITGAVNENTIIPLGTSAIRGSLKYVRSQPGSNAGIRAGGYWWSKPWLGELFPDDTYATQWQPWGNLRAATGSAAGTYKLIRRDGVPSAQLPTGTVLENSYARLQKEGCTSLFNIGTSDATFHHQFAGGQTGSLTEDGPELANNYNFPLPSSAGISRPFSLDWNYSGGVGSEFSRTTEYPRFSAQMVRRFYDHQIGSTGSGLVRLQEPGANPRGGYIVVNGIDKTTESGSAFIARYSMLSLTHSYFAGGLAGPNRIPQLPRVEMIRPTLLTELEDPTSINVEWEVTWRRWDDQKYTESYPENFSEDEATLLYLLMYSDDGGRSWKNMKDDSFQEPGRLPLTTLGVPDMTKLFADQDPTGNETFVWPTPPDSFGEGSYLTRVEAYRSTEALHYSQHMEKIYVNR